METNKVWEEVEDTGQRSMISFLIFRIKPDDDGTGRKLKARIVAGGHQQVAWEDYNPDDTLYNIVLSSKEHYFETTLSARQLN